MLGWRVGALWRRINEEKGEGRRGAIGKGKGEGEEKERGGGNEGTKVGVVTRKTSTMRRRRWDGRRGGVGGG